MHNNKAGCVVFPYLVAVSANVSDCSPTGRNVSNVTWVYCLCWQCIRIIASYRLKHAFILSALPLQLPLPPVHGVQCACFKRHTELANSLLGRSWSGAWGWSAFHRAWDACWASWRVRGGGLCGWGGGVGVCKYNTMHLDTHLDTTVLASSVIASVA